MWARAAQERITTAALVRRALLLMLDEGRPAHDDTVSADKRAVGQVVKVTLRLSSTHAAVLAGQARAADVTQGKYVCGLLDACPPLPLSADHSAAVTELRASTDRVRFAPLRPDRHPGWPRATR